MKNFTNQKGQLLIEAIVAMTIVGIIITGIVTALTYSVNNANISRDQNLATSYAQEGIDVARNMKDSNFTAFAALPSALYNLAPGATTITQTNPPGLLNNKFQRQIYINQTGIDSNNVQICTTGTSVFVASIVTWEDNRCASGEKCHKAELNSCFTDPAKFLY